MFEQRKMRSQEMYWNDEYTKLHHNHHGIPMGTYFGHIKCIEPMSNQVFTISLKIGHFSKCVTVDIQNCAITAHTPDLSRFEKIVKFIGHIEIFLIAVHFFFFLNWIFNYLEINRPINSVKRFALNLFILSFITYAQWVDNICCNKNTELALFFKCSSGEFCPLWATNSDS